MTYLMTSTNIGCTVYSITLDLHNIAFDLHSIAMDSHSDIFQNSSPDFEKYFKKNRYRSAANVIFELRVDTNLHYIIL